MIERFGLGGEEVTQASFERAEEAAAFVRERIAVNPRVAVVLGSGLGSFAASVEQPVAIAYEEIPHFPRPTVEGHSGRLVAGSVAGHARRRNAGPRPRLRGI